MNINRHSHDSIHESNDQQTNGERAVAVDDRVGDLALDDQSPVAAARISLDEDATIISLLLDGTNPEVRP